jgi:hypothetical protein
VIGVVCQNNSCISFLGFDYLPLNPCFTKGFFMLSFALEKQNVLFLQKMMMQSGRDVFQKQNLMVDPSWP